MPEIKVQRDMKIILSLTEEEALHLQGFLGAASSLANEVLTSIEDAIAEPLTDSGIPPAYEFNENEGLFVVRA